MSRYLPLAALLGFALTLGALASSRSTAQSAVHLPPPSAMIGDVRRGRDGQLEVVPRRPSRRESLGPMSGDRTLPPAGTPWMAKDQPMRTPQLQFDESSGD
jgi:hypothetical protein